MPNLLLCPFEALSDPGSKGFTIERDGVPEEIFLVRRGEAVYGYRNSCPHTGGPLDWKPDEYLDDELAYIMCATHAALFRIEDGYCIAGPCKRQSLAPVAIAVKGGAVYLAD